MRLYMRAGPGSFLEVTKVLPLLTAVSADHPSFHVVAPSLPGYAWSEGVLKQGFNAKHYAELGPALFNKLMISLGYTEYVTQGGDWGHICLIASFTSREREAAAASQDFFKSGMGYFREQSTKPQTLGYSLADSPVGLLAWIYEKLVTWTDSYPWTDDEGPAASVRIYYEIGDAVVGFPKTTIPVGLSFFPKELAQLPKVLLRSKGRIVSESDHEAGGHFAAYEQPEALVGDLRKMIGKSGPAAGVVSGCDGY
ncbi:Alpha/Beta hydrolase protein [Lactarius hatsudake]|nr:Alpha/Beta hydrolase protein [Lactarius hatsudake]